MAQNEAATTAEIGRDVRHCAATFSPGAIDCARMQRVEGLQEAQQIRPGVSSELKQHKSRLGDIDLVQLAESCHCAGSQRTSTAFQRSLKAKLLFMKLGRITTESGAPLFLEETAFFMDRCLHTLVTLAHGVSPRTTCELNCWGQLALSPSVTQKSIGQPISASPETMCPGLPQPITSYVYDMADRLAGYPHRTQAVTNTNDQHVELGPLAMPLLPPPRSGPVRRITVLSKSQSWQMYPPRHGWRRLGGALPQLQKTEHPY